MWVIHVGGDPLREWLLLLLHCTSRATPAADISVGGKGTIRRPTDQRTKVRVEIRNTAYRSGSDHTHTHTHTPTVY